MGQMWFKENFISINDVQNLLDKKIVKNPILKNGLSIIYQRSEVKKVGVQKSEEDNTTQHIVCNESLNHITISNAIFSSINSYFFYNPCYMMNNI
jgi:hypothetical protein